MVTPTQLLTYLREEAQPWEALTYLKLHPVAGDAQLAARTMEAVRSGIVMMVARPNFAAELDDMRQRLEASETSPTFKVGQGGSYDLDYLLGTLQLRHQFWLAGNLRDRLRLVHEHGLISDEEHAILAESALFLRSVEHVVRLVTGKAGKWLPVADHAHRSVQRLLSGMLDDGKGVDVEHRLGHALRQARSVYLRYREG